MGTSRILIVEDELILAHDLAILLEGWDHEITGIVSSGEDAIVQADQTCPDLVLMDIILAGPMDGIEAARQIRENLGAAIVYLTAHSERAFLERAKITQPLGYLVKPVSPHELQGTIEMVLYRHNMEKRLRESEERLRSVFSSMDDLVFVMDKTGVLQDCHTRMTKSDYWPGTPETLVGRNFREVLPADLVARLADAVDVVAVTGEVQCLDYPVSTAAGKLWFSAKVSELRGVKGEFSGVTVVARDMTDRKVAEEALKESEAKYRKLVDLAPDGIHVNVEGRFAFANSAMAKMLGLEDPAELLGKSVMDFVHPDYHETIWARLSEVVETDEPVPVVLEQYVRPDGTIIDVEVAATGLTYQGRRGAQVVVRDITERRKAEAALRESEEKYRLVVENANEAIVVVQDELMKFVSPKAQEATGFSREELMSRPFVDFVHPDDKSMVLQRHEKRLRGENVSNIYSFRLIDGAGRLRWIEVNAVIVNWEERLATLNFMSDVTDRRRIEEELLKVEKLQSLGILAGGIAHDFNNILAAILGNVSLAKVYADREDKVYGRLAQAEKACLRAQGLAQQLLTFSSGGAPVKAVADLVKLTRESALFAVQGSRVTCRFSFPEDLWQVEVDEGQMSQVFNNLVINAVHAMDRGGIIEIRGENVVVKDSGGLSIELGNYVKVSIEDKGHGIAEKDLPKIFDPYFTTKNTGSGLGLATSYAIMKRHGGGMTVTSKLGQGTTFDLYLPATEKRFHQDFMSDEHPFVGKGRILLMDDEEPLRELGRELLSALGYHVVLAEDGQEAISLYQQAIQSNQHFDAIIVDLTVPGGLGGHEVLKQLRIAYPSVKAIVSSGYSSDPVMAHYGDYGFAGMVAKPYTVKELSKVLKEVLDLTSR